MQDRNFTFSIRHAINWVTAYWLLFFLILSFISLLLGFGRVVGAKSFELAISAATQFWLIMLLLAVNCCLLSFLIGFLYKIRFTALILFNVLSSILIASYWLYSEILFLSTKSFLPLGLLSAATSDIKIAATAASRSEIMGFVLVIVACVLLKAVYCYGTRTQLRSLQSGVCSVTQWLATCFVSIILIGFLIVEAYSLSEIKSQSGYVFPSEMVIAAINNDHEIHRLDTHKLEPWYSVESWSHQQAKIARPIVIQVMLESIAPDHLGFMGYERNTTPHLDALANDSLILPRVYATSNISSYTQVSILSSQYARRFPTYDPYTDIDYDRTTIFDVLNAVDYETYFFSAQNEHWQGMTNFTREGKHFTRFWHSVDYYGTRLIGLEQKVDDHLVVQQALQALSNRDSNKPFILNVNFQKTHAPYDLPQGHQGQWQPSDTSQIDFKFFGRYDDFERKPDVINKYDNALAYVDGQVGKLIRYLKAKGLYEQALIIVTSDHGQALFKDGYLTHGTSLHDPQIRSFALIKHPEQAKTGIVDTAVSAVDLLPTVMSILGLRPFAGFQGVDLTDNSQLQRSRNLFVTNQAIIFSDAIIQFPYKLITYPDRPVELFNLTSDPQETNNVANLYPQRVNEMKRALEQHIKQQVSYYSGHPELRKYFFVPKPWVNALLE